MPRNTYATSLEAIDDTVSGRQTSPDAVTNANNIIDDGTYEESVFPSYSFP